MRGVVFQAGGVQRVENHRLGRTEFFRAAGEHHRQTAELDRFIGVADALAAAGAGAGGGDQAALEAEEDADIGRCSVRHHADIGVGIQAVGHRVEQHIAERLDLVGAAGGRAAGHAHPTVLNAFVAEQASVFQRTFGGVYHQFGDAAHAAGLFAIPVLGLHKVIHRAAEAGVQLAETVPLVHIADAALTGPEVRFNRRPVAAQRGHAGHAGDYHPFASAHQHNPPFTARTWRVM